MLLNSVLLISYSSSKHQRDVIFGAKAHGLFSVDCYSIKGFKWLMDGSMDGQTDGRNENCIKC